MTNDDMDPQTMEARLPRTDGTPKPAPLSGLAADTAGLLSLFENATQGIFQSTPEGQYLTVNPALARIYGFATPTDMMLSLTNIGEQLYIDPERRAHFRWELETLGEVQGFESRVRRKDGRTIWISESARAVRDDTDAVLYYEGFVKDITLRKEAEAALQRAHADLERRVAERTADLEREVSERRNAQAALKDALVSAERATRAKSSFLANVSHELRTPLNAIIGFSDMMDKEVLGPIENDHYRGYVCDIQSSALHLLDLINDVLDLSKIEAGHLELEEEAVVPEAVIANALRMIEDRAERAGVSISVEAPDRLPDIRGDERRLTQVLLNLLSNAVKFTPKGGTVAVEVTLAENGQVSILVRDNGIGMKPEDIPKALAEFEQVEDGLAHNPDGTGLGLPLSKRLVEAHGGTFTLTSAPGRGTVAEVRLPGTGN